MADQILPKGQPLPLSILPPPDFTGVISIVIGDNPPVPITWAANPPAPAAEPPPEPAPAEPPPAETASAPATTSVSPASASAPAPEPPPDPLDRRIYLTITSINSDGKKSVTTFPDVIRATLDVAVVKAGMGPGSSGLAGATARTGR